jgi:hypothetical protein
MFVGSLLTKEQLKACLYTANAATGSERFTFASLSAWLIENLHAQTGRQKAASPLDNEEEKRI